MRSHSFSCRKRGTACTYFWYMTQATELGVTREWFMTDVGSGTFIIKG